MRASRKPVNKIKIKQNKWEFAVAYAQSGSSSTFSKSLWSLSEMASRKNSFCRGRRTLKTRRQSHPSYE